MSSLMAARLRAITEQFNRTKSNKDSENERLYAILQSRPEDRSEKDLIVLLRFMSRLRLAMKLTKRQRLLVARAFTMKRYEQGSMVCKAGDTADVCYRVLSGDCYTTRTDALSGDQVRLDKHFADEILMEDEFRKSSPYPTGIEAARDLIMVELPAVPTHRLLAQFKRERDASQQEDMDAHPDAVSTDPRKCGDPLKYHAPMASLHHLPNLAQWRLMMLATRREYSGDTALLREGLANKTIIFTVTGDCVVWKRLVSAGGRSESVQLAVLAAPQIIGLSEGMHGSTAPFSIATRGHVVAFTADPLALSRSIAMTELMPLIRESHLANQLRLDRWRQQRQRVGSALLQLRRKEMSHTGAGSPSTSDDDDAGGSGGGDHHSGASHSLVRHPRSTSPTAGVSPVYRHHSPTRGGPGGGDDGGGGGMGHSDTSSPPVGPGDSEGALVVRLLGRRAIESWWSDRLKTEAAAQAARDRTSVGAKLSSWTSLRSAVASHRHVGPAVPGAAGEFDVSLGHIDHNSRWKPAADAARDVQASLLQSSPARATAPPSATPSAPSPSATPPLRPVRLADSALMCASVGHRVAAVNTATMPWQRPPTGTAPLAATLQPATEEHIGDGYAAPKPRRTRVVLPLSVSSSAPSLRPAPSPPPSLRPAPSPPPSLRPAPSPPPSLRPAPSPPPSLRPAPSPPPSLRPAPSPPPSLRPAPSLPPSLSSSSPHQMLASPPSPITAASAAHRGRNTSIAALSVTAREPSPRDDHDLGGHTDPLYSDTEAAAADLSSAAADPDATLGFGSLPPPPSSSTAPSAAPSHAPSAAQGSTGGCRRKQRRDTAAVAATAADVSPWAATAGGGVDLNMTRMSGLSRRRSTLNSTARLRGGHYYRFRAEETTGPAVVQFGEVPRGLQRSLTELSSSLRLSGSAALSPTASTNLRTGGRFPATAPTITGARPGDPSMYVGSAARGGGGGGSGGMPRRRSRKRST